MASLFKSGLIHGFFVLDGATRPHATPEPDVLLAVDLRGDAALARFEKVKKAFANEQMAKNNGNSYVRTSVVQENWIEIRVDGARDDDDLFAFYGVSLKFQTVSEFSASVWVTDADKRRVFKVIQAEVRTRETPSDSPTGTFKDAFEVRDLQTYAGSLNGGTQDEINEDMMWLVRQAFALAIMAGGGFVRARRTAHTTGKMLFSEDRQMKRNAFELVKRKRLLRSFDVHEVDADLTLSAAAEAEEPWQEFDPITARREGHRGPRSECRQHVVREFKRRSKSGKVSTVKSFLRGNPSLGFVHKMQRVTIPE